jgi:cell division GTPase FtsZ
VRLAILGVGQAGGKVLDKFLEYDQRTDGQVARAAVAVNTAKTDLEGLEYVPRDHRILVGQSSVKGQGVGGDNELGARIAERDLTEVQRALDHVPIEDVDAFLVVAALGGGTGSGGAPVFARHLGEVFHEPVYGLGILPASDEGAIYTLNAARSFRTFVEEVDNLLLFDNDAWRQANATVSESYEALNEELVNRFGVMFRAGELEDDAVAESVVDASEITNTLDCGGVSTMGYATAQLPERAKGLLARFRHNGVAEEYDSTSAIAGLVRQATRGRLTLPCEVEGAERALVVVAGPQPFLDRKGLDRARRWLEEETGSMEVRGGDFPIGNTDKLAVAVMFAGVTEVPRLAELQVVASDSLEKIDARREERARNVDDLLTPSDDLDTLL